VTELNGPPFASHRHPLPSGLLHDLRTPLNHIIGYSELMIEEAQGEDPSSLLLPHLQKVSAAAHHMATLITENFEAGPRPAEPLGKAAREEQPPMAEPVVWRTGTRQQTASGDLASAAARGSLLIVDDDEANRVVLTRRLKRQGYAVAAAENGERALDMLHADTYDAVLLDIVMPDPDGFEVLRRIKADARLKHLPVIVTSSLAEVESAARCIELGAEDYLIKPFHPTLLQARVGASLERKRARDRERYLFEQLQENYRRLQSLEKSSGEPSAGLVGLPSRRADRGD
jgi:PleD family two-component response regulator